MEQSDIIWTIKRDKITQMAKEGKREDGRQPYEYRPVELKPNYVERAEGSCLVKLGETQILVGVKMSVGEPYPDSPDKGNMMVNTELIPMASPIFSAGPPNEDSIELARVVDRGIRESKMIDTSKLCITEGEAVWTVLIDMHVLDYDGNLIDAASLAAVNALWNTHFPKYEDGKIVTDEKTSEYLPVTKKPVACTFAKLGDTFLLDPSLGEEKSTDGRITISTTDEGRICAMQKSGAIGIMEKDLYSLVDISMEKGNEMRALYKRA